MHTHKSLKISLTLSMFFSATAFSQTDSETYSKAKSTLDSEYAKEKRKFIDQLMEHRKTLAELVAQKNQAMKFSVELSKKENDGVGFFKNYIKLLKVRYSDALKGKYQEGLQISDEDVKNINSLFTAYLKETPLQGKVSAQIAVMTLEKGKEKLNDFASAHSHPDEENNSEMGIVAKRSQEINENIEVIYGLAEQLEVDVKSAKALASKEQSDDSRAPASIKK